LRNGKYYLAEKELLEHIREIWSKEWEKNSDRKLNNNSISVQVCPNSSEASKAWDYVTKHLGKGSDITNALYRFRIGKATSSDIAKLFCNFWGYKLHNMRLYSTSINLGKEQ